jgi:serine/threonine-protein kinase RsbT
MSNVVRTQKVPVRAEQDVVVVRQGVRKITQELRFSLVDQTKMVTAASELARNLLIYGGGGEVELDVLQEESRNGVRAKFIDHGPGIADIEQALKDGYTSGSGLGLGLGGAKRLVNDFAIDSKPGEGTRITITRWK